MDFTQFFVCVSIILELKLFVMLFCDLLASLFTSREIRRRELLICRLMILHHIGLLKPLGTMLWSAHR